MLSLVFFYIFFRFDFFDIAIYEHNVSNLVRTLYGMNSVKIKTGTRTILCFICKGKTGFITCLEPYVQSFHDEGQFVRTLLISARFYRYEGVRKRKVSFHRPKSNPRGPYPPSTLLPPHALYFHPDSMQVKHGSIVNPTSLFHVYYSFDLIR